MAVRETPPPGPLKPAARAKAVGGEPAAGELQHTPSPQREVEGQEKQERAVSSNPKERNDKASAGK